MNIVLTGFMASGKTEISKELAKLLGFKLVDTDEYIVKKTGMSINEIFEKMGESEFRRIEHDAICEVSKSDNTVISTGGGVPVNPQNMKRLRENSIIVNLAPTFDVIEARMESARQTRPLMKDQDIGQIKKRFDDRRPFYDDCDIKVPVSNEHPPKYFAEYILNKIHNEAHSYE